MKRHLLLWGLALLLFFTGISAGAADAADSVIFSLTSPHASKISSEQPILLAASSRGGVCYLQALTQGGGLFSSPQAGVQHNLTFDNGYEGYFPANYYSYAGGGASYGRASSLSYYLLSADTMRFGSSPIKSQDYAIKPLANGMVATLDPAGILSLASPSGTAAPLLRFDYGDPLWSEYDAPRERYVADLCYSPAIKGYVLLSGDTRAPLEEDDFREQRQFLSIAMFDHMGYHISDHDIPGLGTAGRGVGSFSGAFLSPDNPYKLYCKNLTEYPDFYTGEPIRNGYFEIDLLEDSYRKISFEDYKKAEQKKRDAEVPPVRVEGRAGGTYLLDSASGRQLAILEGDFVPAAYSSHQNGDWDILFVSQAQTGTALPRHPYQGAE